MRRIGVLCALLFLLVGVAQAGEPIRVEIVCPVGGEAFEITSTSSCSSRGRTLSFRPDTSCDFVTRLPVCPSNGLPVYKEFSEDEIADLTEWMESAEYSDLLGLSPWVRSYRVEEHLDEVPSSIGFNVLMQMMWYEPEAFLASNVALDLLIAETGPELERQPPDARPLLEAILGAALMFAGRDAEAVLKLEGIGPVQERQDVLDAYKAALLACVGRTQDEACQPNTPFRP